MKNFLFLLINISFLTYNYAQTTLAVGDIAVVYLQADTPDDFAFIPFVDLAVGTEIYFTDCGADASGFNTPCGEGAVKYTASSFVEAGTVILYDGNSDFTSYTDSRITGSMALAASGDQILAFQDSDTANATDPGEEPTFIFAINAASTLFDGDKTDSNQTGLPDGLSTTSPITALGVGAGTGNEDEYDNVVYDDTLDFPTIAALKVAVTDPTNYLGSNDITNTVYVTAVDNLSEITLPVVLYDFDAILNNNSVRLIWSTTHENNSNKFVIERSTDNSNFSEIASVKASIYSNSLVEYSFQDFQLQSGTNYYRLNLIDFDGKSQHLKTIKVHFGKKMSNSNYHLYPNPVRDNTLYIATNFSKETTVEVSVYNVFGQLLSLDRHEVQLGNKTISIQLDNLTSGNYIIKISNTGESKYLPFVYSQE